MKITAKNITSHFRANRETVFEQLYHNCFPQVARMVRALGGNQVDAEDIFQDCLLVLYEKSLSGKLNIQSSINAYVLGIAKHLWVRQQRNDTHLLELNPQINIPETTFHVPERPKLRFFKLMEAVGKKCMELLQAFYYQHLSAQQLADDFGFRSARSATVQKHKCLEKVRNQVKQKKLNYEEVVE